MNSELLRDGGSSTTHIRIRHRTALVIRVQPALDTIRRALPIIGFHFVRGCSSPFLRYVGGSARVSPVRRFAYQPVNAAASSCESLREAPNWQSRVNGAHTLPRVLEAVRKFEFDPTQITEILRGNECPSRYLDVIPALNEALTIVELLRSMDILTLRCSQ